MRAFHRAGAIAAVALVTGLSGVLVAASVITASAQTAGKTMTTSSGLQITDSVIGTGATPKTGQTCVMHYTGWLYENGVKGKKFDSSVDRGQPFEFPIGAGRVIRGWDEGVATMKVGGKAPSSFRPHSATAPVAPAVSSRRTPRSCLMSNCWR